MALFRSNSAPVESSSSVPSPTPMTPTHGKTATSQVTPTQMRNISNVHKAYRSYSDDSSNYSSGSSGSFDLPPSRYHHTKKFKRRVTFNEAVQVFEVSRIPILEPEVEKVQQIVPYTKTRMKIKKDTVKFEEIVSTPGPISVQVWSTSGLFPIKLKFSEIDETSNIKNPITNDVICPRQIESPLMKCRLVWKIKQEKYRGYEISILFKILTI